MWVGADTSSAAGMFDGAMSDLAFWTHALSASEAVSVYENGPGAVTSGLVGWWPMDEGFGTTIYDASGAAVDGVVNGTGTWTQRCSDGTAR